MAEQMARDADVARHREASMPVGAVKRQAWTALRAQQRPYGRKDRGKRKEERKAERLSN